MNRLYVILLSIALFGCSKEEEKILKDPVEMTFDKLEPVSEMRVFVENGAQLDPKIYSEAIQSFLDRYYTTKTNTAATFHNSKFFEPSTDSDYGNPIFTFYDNGRITYAAEIKDVKKFGDAVVMKSTVTNQLEDDPIITSDLFKYKHDTNSNGSYNVQYVVHGDDQSLDVSLLYYKLVRYDDKGNRKQLAFGTIYNELNESFIRTLTKFDTLAVKEYRIRYSVK